MAIKKKVINTAAAGVIARYIREYLVRMMPADFREESHGTRASTFLYTHCSYCLLGVDE